MIARPTGLRFVLAAFGSLTLSGAGLAETRLMFDPDGVVVPKADGSYCCATGDSAVFDAGPASAGASVPASPDVVADDGPAPAAEVAVPTDAARVPSGISGMLSALMQAGSR